MKRYGLALLIILALFLCGCRASESQSLPQQSTVAVVTTEHMAQDKTTREQKTTEAVSEQTEESTEEVTTEEPATEEKTTEENAVEENEAVSYKEYHFKNKSRLNDHYEKHGKEMGFDSAKEYEQAASDVVNNPDALHKTEKEDGDDVYYVEATNEFVVVSKQGFLRTYFLPDKGIDYFNRQ
ncbi:MAG: hypothetical protein IKO61_11505 [Lachnospiraceae bacterium]|nr:hypothetical protein [Lachnospiraceae bacterium]